MIRFEVRHEDSLGTLIGTVEADNCFRAAELACVKFFGGVTALRETGWGGGNGTWKTLGVKKKTITFWLGAATTVPNKPPVPPKPIAAIPPKTKPAKRKANSRG